MTGRDNFNNFRFIIFFMVKLIGVLPKSVRIFVFNCMLTSMPTLFGVVLRYVFIKSLSKYVGDNVYVARWVVLKNMDNLSIGNNVSIHENCFLDAKGEIEIGDDVSIAHQCSLVSFEHDFSSSNKIKYNELLLNKIIISNDVWIGCGTRILAGSSIGYRTVIGANSVVKGELSNGVYVGSPARLVKRIK